MDYSIGSVADLISGKSTPNKPKVLQKQVKSTSKKHMHEVDEENITSNSAMKSKNGSFSPEILINNKSKLLKKRKHTEVIDSEESPIDSEQAKNPKKKRKRNRKESVDKGILQDSPKQSQHVLEAVEQSTENNVNDTSLNQTSNADVSDSTIFVGNLPLSLTHKKLEKLFSKVGEVLNARIRSVPVADPKLPKKVACIKKKFHEERNSVNGYVTFSTRADAEKALSLNGTQYKDHHIRVNLVDEKLNLDKNKAIFLGNVNFAAEEEELWKLFEPCGEIESVRLVRDPLTDVGKGFGYINFKSTDSVELALQMGEVKLRDRVLRVSLYNGKAPKKAKKKYEQGQNNRSDKAGARNRNYGQKPAKVNKMKQGQFQGKFSGDKKKKFNKGNHQKKQLAKKIAPRSIGV